MGMLIEKERNQLVFINNCKQYDPPITKPYTGLVEYRETIKMHPRAPLKSNMLSTSMIMTIIIITMMHHVPYH